MMDVFTDDTREMMRERDCRECLYFIPGVYACSRGFRKCVWIEPVKPVKKKSPCDGCPYGRREPCLGICMKEVLKTWRDERKEAVVYA